MEKTAADQSDSVVWRAPSPIRNPEEVSKFQEIYLELSGSSKSKVDYVKMNVIWNNFVEVQQREHCFRIFFQILSNEMLSCIRTLKEF